MTDRSNRWASPAPARFRRPLSALLALSLLAEVTPAFAQPKPPPPPPPAPGAPAPGAPAAPVDDAKLAESKAHFLKGLKLLEEEAWTAALAEFLASRELNPTRSATNNAAIALRKLQRFDESLDMFEALLRDYPNMPQGERTLAQRNVAELRDLVGTIDVQGAEPGAAILIDGQARGEYPPIAPLRVSAGSHLIRVFKEGFEPFEVRADVAGGQVSKVAAKLRALQDSGRLSVTERSGSQVEVVVDNVTVGITPWEGLLAVGDHTVVLKGKGRIGTQPVSASVKSQQVTSLTLIAEELDAALRVEPTPSGATVAIDSVVVGHGIWLGWLKSGTHTVEISNEGFLPVSRQVKLERGGRELVNVSLDRDPKSALWRKPSHWEIDGSAGFAVIPSFGGQVGDQCAGSCSALGIGAAGSFNAGYQLGIGIGFGLSLGYVAGFQSLTGRGAKLTPRGETAKSGTADESLRLSAFMGGANVFYHLGDRFPVLFRLGFGALVGQVRDQRTGQFTDVKNHTYKTFAAADLEEAVYLHVDPEIRFGVRLGEHVDLTAGVQALVLLAIKQPAWNQGIEVGPAKGQTSADGVGNYASESLMGKVVFGIVPGLNLRYEF